MFHLLRNRKKLLPAIFGIMCMLILTLFVAACGGAGNTSGSADSSLPVTGPAQNTSNSSGSTSSSSKNATGQQQYLVKSFAINMQVRDTQKVATDLQAWITTTDPLALVNNANYQQVAQNQYSITMSFSVQASLFPRIESYLNSYPALHSGKLLNVTMNTQDVSSDFVDSQSRLKNLQAEQQRLLALMGSAGALSGVLTIDQRLTDVEGQIEQLEAHLQDIKGQTSFYTVVVNLQPAEVVVTPPSPAGWNLGDVWQGAIAGVKAVGQVLATVFIWLLVFCVYIVPLGIIAWLARRWWNARAVKAAKVTP